MWATTRWLVPFVLLLTLTITSPAAAARSSGPHGVAHAQTVIHFFDHHKALARTPAGQKALWKAIHQLDVTVRSLQSVHAASATWLASVSYVGRYFGQGIAAWELSCSHPGSEGGWTEWVWNGGAPASSSSHGSGAGGWLQFMQGTFDGIIDKGIATARSRGMIVPASARSFFSPLGQAIAGAQMILDGRRGEWSGYGC